VGDSVPNFRIVKTCCARPRGGLYTEHPKVWTVDTEKTIPCLEIAQDTLRSRSLGHEKPVGPMRRGCGIDH
jgi:hypothetical protein